MNAIAAVVRGRWRRRMRERLGDFRFCQLSAGPGNLLLAIVPLVAIGLAGCPPLPAAEPTTRNAAQRDERLKERDRLFQEAKQLQTTGKLDEAVVALDRALAVHRQVFADPGEGSISILKDLATLHLKRNDFTAARGVLEEVLAIRVKQFGEQHWKVADARRAVADGNFRSKLSKDQLKELTAADDAVQSAVESHHKGQFNQALKFTVTALEIRKRVLGEQHLDYTVSLHNLAVLYEAMGDYARAVPLTKQALEIRKKSLGEQHPYYATSLNYLALLYQSMGEYTRAEPLHKQALQIDKEALGEQHPDYATDLNNLALLYYSMEDYTRAEPLYRQALAIRKNVLSEQDPNYATSLNTLADLYLTTGDYARAEPLFKQAVAIRKNVFGDQHPTYALSVNSLAKLYKAMGDYARAEPLYKQVLEIRKKVFGEHHPYYAGSLSDMALLHALTGKYAQAEPLYKQAQEIRKKALGEQHPDYATGLNNLAALYWRTDDYARAEPLFKQALEIDKRALGEQSPGYATDMNNLGALYYSMQDYARAESLYTQALEIRKTALGEQNPDYANSLLSLALLFCARGDYTRAEPLAIEAIHIMRNGLELTAVVQSERQQLAMNDAVRFYLDNYLVITGDGKFPPDKAYAQVLARKGAVSARQALIHRLRDAAAKRPEVARLFGELEHASREFAARSRRVPALAQQEAHRQRLTQLSAAIENLEQQLAAASAEFRQQLVQRQLSPKDVIDALPPDAALIDFLEYYRVVRPPQKSGKSTWERHVVAFVVRHDQPIVRIDLGLANPIRLAIEAWRRRFAPGSEAGPLPSDPAQVVADPAGDMRRLIWEPLAPYVKDASTLLISPDGALARFPWPAMPTSEPGHYLIEDKAIAIVPIPQLLPELLAAKDQRDQAAPTLLLVGDVDYGAAAGAPTLLAEARSAERGSRGGSLPNWDELPNTRSEIVTVRDSFEQRFPSGDVKVLRKEAPTEDRIREMACKYQYLHFATHGFFAPPDLRSALMATSRSGDAPGRGMITRQDLAGFHPGLLSGIVLAGANHEVVADADDGILTALEVAQLDLGRVELATLSACETGLGERAGGEGLLGLQRAFQTAGAHSVVGSLWKLSDDAARQLMIDFYDNLWTKKMSKVEALRQAQLSMLREGLKRGAKRLDDDPATDADKRTPPDLWAAFELSGDWR